MMLLLDKDAIQVTELDVEHIEAKPVDATEEAYWHSMADEVCNAGK